MTSKKGARAGAKAGRAPTPRRHRRPPWLAWMVVATLVAAGAFALLSRRGGGSVEEVLVRAREAEQRSDFPSAFGIYREGLRQHPGNAILLGSFATATQNGSYAVRTNRGRLVPVMPMSRDRVAAARAALSLLDESERAAPRLPQPALHRGLLYAAWGLPEDALVELYRARMLGSDNPEIDRVGGAITLLQLGRGDELGPVVPDSAQKGRPASR